jgi:hypothetical protein
MVGQKRKLKIGEQTYFAKKLIERKNEKVISICQVNRIYILSALCFLITVL